MKATAMEMLDNSSQSARTAAANQWFEHHADPGFLDACYAAAPARMQAAFAAEIEYLRRVLNGAGRALEIGCGNARVITALRGTGYDWVGVDLMEPYLVTARTRRFAVWTGFAAGQASRLPLADAAFDAVVCPQSTLGLLGDEKAAALAEAGRVARRGAKLIFVVYSELSVVPRVEWYSELRRRGMMAPLDWAHSDAELLRTEDRHFSSECFRRPRLQELFRSAGLAPRIERLGEVYWTVEAERV